MVSPQIPLCLRQRANTLPAYASEAFDRLSLQDEFSDQLVKNVATNCSNTIVVIHNAGIRTVDEWIEHPNVTAVVYAGLPGQEIGNSIADVLYGDISVGTYAFHDRQERV
jgi:beta-glucosidase